MQSQQIKPRTEDKNGLQIPLLRYNGSVDNLDIKLGRKHYVYYAMINTAVLKECNIHQHYRVSTHISNRETE